MHAGQSHDTLSFKTNSHAVQYVCKQSCTHTHTHTHTEKYKRILKSTKDSMQKYRPKVHLPKEQNGDVEFAWNLWSGNTKSWTHSHTHAYTHTHKYPKPCLHMLNARRELVEGKWHTPNGRNVFAFSNLIWPSQLTRHSKSIIYHTPFSDPSTLFNFLNPFNTPDSFLKIWHYWVSLICEEQ